METIIFFFMNLKSCFQKKKILWEFLKHFLLSLAKDSSSKILGNYKRIAHDLFSAFLISNFPIAC